MVSIFQRMANGANRLSHAWNAFTNVEEERTIGFGQQQYGSASGVTPNRRRLTGGNERSIVAAIYMRLGIDYASIDMRHARVDPNGRYLEDIPSGLNECLTLEANLDQGASAFRQDLAMTLFDKGAIAAVPIDTSLNPLTTGNYDIRTMRIGDIVQWYPRHIRVSVWNDMKGRREELTVPKSSTAIIENPLYQVMNEPNSTLQRLIRKLNILDAVDEASSSGKLDIIIQLPYTIKSEARKDQAENRLKDIEMQLKGSKYGIAYADATEKITQLNRPAENNLLSQIEYLTKMVYGQLGLSEAVFNGTASEAEMLNYHVRTIEPLTRATTEAFRRSFLTKTARTQGQSILAFRDPFKLVPVGAIAEIADKFTRNEILTANEIRGIIGYRPSTDAKADKLVNSNMPQPNETAPAEASVDNSAVMAAQDKLMEDTFASLEASIDSAIGGA